MKCQKEKLSKTDKSRLKRAMKLAKISTCKQKHGAIIIKGGSVLSVGINRNKNNPTFVGEATKNWSVHAEAAAIKACAGADLRNAIIYVARINKAHEPMMSKPCQKCEKLIREAGIRKVVYTIDSQMVF